jgi:hypothetical protein
MFVSKKELMVLKELISLSPVTRKVLFPAIPPEVTLAPPPPLTTPNSTVLAPEVLRDF